MNYEEIEDWEIEDEETDERALEVFDGGDDCEEEENEPPRRRDWDLHEAEARWASGDDSDDED